MSSRKRIKKPFAGEIPDKIGIFTDSVSAIMAHTETGWFFSPDTYRELLLPGPQRLCNFFKSRSLPIDGKVETGGLLFGADACIINNAGKILKRGEIPAQTIVARCG